MKLLTIFLIVILTSCGDSTSTIKEGKSYSMEYFGREGTSRFGCGFPNTQSSLYFFVIDENYLGIQSGTNGSKKFGQPCRMKYSKTEDGFKLIGTEDCRFSNCYDSWSGNYKFIKPYTFDDGSSNKDGMWVNQRNKLFVIDDGIYSKDYVFWYGYNEVWHN